MQQEHELRQENIKLLGSEMCCYRCNLAMKRQSHRTNETLITEELHNNKNGSRSDAWREAAASREYQNIMAKDADVCDGRGITRMEVDRWDLGVKIWPATRWWPQTDWMETFRIYPVRSMVNRKEINSNSNNSSSSSSSSSSVVVVASSSAAVILNRFHDQSFKCR